MFWKMESLFVLTLLVLVAEVSFVAADDGKDFLHSFLCLPLLDLLSLSLFFNAFYIMDSLMVSDCLPVLPCIKSFEMI